MEKTFTGDEFLWSQFCRLGEMIGDGLANEKDLWRMLQWGRNCTARTSKGE